jgi:SAM-dependent methyltransferase
MLADFLAYERRLGREQVLPLLESLGMDLRDRAVLDVGCGYGGVILELDRKYPLSRGLGLDVDPEMIAEARRQGAGRIRFEAADFFRQGDAEKYDLILMRDVLEHIVDVEGALRKARGLLAPAGRIYLSFAPFYSPFGGHQHNGGGFFACLPWLQLLPEGLFRRLLSIEGNSYKSGDRLREDMETVLRTRLTLGRFREAAARAGLQVGYHAQYLSRPDYRIKFGLPALRFPRWPGLEEILCTGAEAVLSPA